MIYVNIKSEVKKLIQKQWIQLEMKLGLGDYIKSTICEGDFSGAGNEQDFFYFGGFCSHLQGFP